MGYVFWGIIIVAILVLVTRILLRRLALKDPKFVVCPTCHTKINFLAHGGVCQDCAWDDFAKRMKNKYN